MTDTLNLAKTLMHMASITPDDKGCQAHLRERLQMLGFTCEDLPYGLVSNLWAVCGDTGPLFVFAGHTDVVPPGDDEAWTSPPFNPAVINGQLIGRGAVDMKGAIAAMVIACERFFAQCSEPRFRLGFLLTSDEEDGSSGNGTAKVLQTLKQRGICIDYCLLGEPTSITKTVDMIKNGRRGSLSGKCYFHGLQGHIAYPALANNPIPLAMQACVALTQEIWDQGDEFFQPSQFQISNIHAGTGVGNVIPATVLVDFNFRYSPALTVPIIQSRVQTILEQFDIEYSIDWSHSGAPFLTPPGKLVDVINAAIVNVTGTKPALSTSGGTSDGRFIAPYGVEVVECGLSNASAHKVDEHVDIADLERLTDIYEQVLTQFNLLV